MGCALASLHERVTWAIALSFIQCPMLSCSSASLSGTGTWSSLRWHSAFLQKLHFVLRATAQSVPDSLHRPTVSTLALAHGEMALFLEENRRQILLAETEAPTDMIAAHVHLMYPSYNLTCATLTGTTDYEQ